MALGEKSSECDKESDIVAKQHGYKEIEIVPVL